MLPARIIADLNIGGCELMFDNFDIDVKHCGTLRRLSSFIPAET